MALKEQLQKFQSVKRCYYMELYKTLPKEDQQVLDSALKNNVPIHQIVKALRADGYRTTRETVKAHKNGDCICPKA